METMNNLIPGWKVEDYQDYQRLKQDEQKRLNQAKSDYNKVSVRVPEEVLFKVPETKKDDVLHNAKMEIINLEMTKAQQLIVKANSPLREQEIASLKVNYRNFHRQLIWNEVRLKLLREKDKDKESFTDRDNKIVYSFELKYIIDKLKGDLYFMEKDLKLYGLEPTAVLNE